jgi:hypothetical protein
LHSPSSFESLMNSLLLNLLNIELSPEVCDARDDDTSLLARYQNNF